LLGLSFSHKEERSFMAKSMDYGIIFFLMFSLNLSSSQAMITESAPQPIPSETQGTSCQESSHQPKGTLCDIMDRFQKLTKDQRCLIDATHRKLICEMDTTPKNSVPPAIWMGLCIQALIGPFAHCPS
jgi:hypothetical protein